MGGVGGGPGQVRGRPAGTYRRGQIFLSVESRCRKLICGDFSSEASTQDRPDASGRQAVEGAVEKGTFMHTVTKKELVDRIAESTGSKRVVVKRIVQTFLDEIIEELGRGNRLEFRDFGVFETKERAARTAQNPKTLQRVHVPPKRTVKFKVGRLMKIKLHEGMETGAD
jgi:integration host factor subunit beta